MMLTGASYPANASSLPKATQLLSSRAGKMEAMTPSQRLPDYTPPHTPSPGLASHLSALPVGLSPLSLGPSHLALCRPLHSPDPHHHPLCSISVVLSPASPFSSPLAALPIICLASLLQEAPSSFSKPCIVWGLSLGFSWFMCIPGSPSPLEASSLVWWNKNSAHHPLWTFS